MVWEAGTLVAQLKLMIELHKHRAHVPLLLAKKQGRGQSSINKRSSFEKEIYCMIVPVVKYREIFQNQ